ncbi:MAG: proline dehydrogenase family protein, partial [Chloroflexia bacterium]|nr:proline dehydrogenase family protein [Chloroflexia bacterium]
MVSEPATNATHSGRWPNVFLSLNPIFRRAILGATGNPLVSRGVRRYGMRLGASRFVAGERFDQCLPVLRGLNARGFRTNTTLLGEGVREEPAARAVLDEYLIVLDCIAQERLTTNLSVKLTHLGLDLGEDFAYRHVAELTGRAATHDNFVRIDMEESTRVDATLRIYRRLRADGHDNVGTVLQSYLYRTDVDLDDLLPLAPNLRLVKGAYLEPASVARPKKADADTAYLRLAERMLAGTGFCALATHDERLIDHLIAFIARAGIGPERVEFQMLYGIRPDLQAALVERGHRVLVATPYGPEWYPFLMRRLAERPANLLFFARNLVRR